MKRLNDFNLEINRNRFNIQKRLHNKKRGEERA